MTEKLLFVYLSTAGITPSLVFSGGMRLHSLLGHYATSRKVAGSIHDEVIGIFSLPNPSRRTMALGSTQPLTEMRTKNLPGAKGG
jgi:hypothetical protein